MSLPRKTAQKVAPVAPRDVLLLPLRLEKAPLLEPHSFGRRPQEPVVADVRRKRDLDKEREEPFARGPHLLEHQAPVPLEPEQVRGLLLHPPPHPPFRAFEDGRLPLVVPRFTTAKAATEQVPPVELGEEGADEEGAARHVVVFAPRPTSAAPAAARPLEEPFPHSPQLLLQLQQQELGTPLREAGRLRRLRVERAAVSPQEVRGPLARVV